MIMPFILPSSIPAYENALSMRLVEIPTRLNRGDHVYLLEPKTLVLPGNRSVDAYRAFVISDAGTSHEHGTECFLLVEDVHALESA